jgi:hypothetical protein
MLARVTRTLVIALALTAFAAYAKPKATELGKCEVPCKADQQLCDQRCKKVAPKAGALCTNECVKLEKACVKECKDQDDRRRRTHRH